MPTDVYIDGCGGTWMSNHMCIFEKRARDRLFFEHVRHATFGRTLKMRRWRQQGWAWRRKVRFRLCFGLLLSSAHVWGSMGLPSILFCPARQEPKILGMPSKNPEEIAVGVVWWMDGVEMPTVSFFLCWSQSLTGAVYLALHIPFICHWVCNLYPVIFEKHTTRQTILWACATCRIWKDRKDETLKATRVSVEAQSEVPSMVRVATEFCSCLGRRPCPIFLFCPGRQGPKILGMPSNYGEEIAVGVVWWMDSIHLGLQCGSINLWEKCPKTDYSLSVCDMPHVGGSENWDAEGNKGGRGGPKWFFLGGE